MFKIVIFKLLITTSGHTSLINRNNFVKHMSAVIIAKVINFISMKLSGWAIYLFEAYKMGWCLGNQFEVSVCSKQCFCSDKRTEHQNFPIILFTNTISILQNLHSEGERNCNITTPTINHICRIFSKTKFKYNTTKAFFISNVNGHYKNTL